MAHQAGVGNGHGGDVQHRHRAAAAPRALGHVPSDGARLRSEGGGVPREHSTAVAVGGVPPQGAAGERERRADGGDGPAAKGGAARLRALHSDVLQAGAQAAQEREAAPEAAPGAVGAEGGGPADGQVHPAARREAAAAPRRRLVALELRVGQREAQQRRACVPRVDGHNGAAAVARERAVAPQAEAGEVPGERVGGDWRAVSRGAAEVAPVGHEARAVDSSLAVCRVPLEAHAKPRGGRGGHLGCGPRLRARHELQEHGAGGARVLDCERLLEAAEGNKGRK